MGKQSLAWPRKRGYLATEKAVAGTLGGFPTAAVLVHGGSAGSFPSDSPRSGQTLAVRAGPRASLWQSGERPLEAEDQMLLQQTW